MADVLAIPTWYLYPGIPDVDGFEYHGSSTATQDGATTIDIDIPAGTEDGDYLLLFINPQTISSPPTPTVSPGTWALEENAGYGKVVRSKVWHTGDATTYTATHSTTSSSAIMLAFAGVSSVGGDGGINWNSNSGEIGTLPDINCRPADVFHNGASVGVYFASQADEGLAVPLSGNAPLTNVVTAGSAETAAAAGWDTDMMNEDYRVFTGADQIQRYAITCQMSLKTIYPAAAMPFLTEFPDYPTFPQWPPDNPSPTMIPSVQYRDADTGELLAVHPYSETPPYAAGGGDEDQSDIAAGLSLGPDGAVYLNGWATGGTWRLNVDGSEQWRLDGYDQDPEPDFYSFAEWPLVSPDGTLLYTYHDPNGTLAVLDTADGSVVDEIVYSDAHEPAGGLIWMPDGNILFGSNEGASDTHGLYVLDVSDGTITPWLLLDTAFPVSPYDTSPYGIVFQVARHPGGDGLAMVVDTFRTGPSTWYSAIVEVGWDGIVTDVYTTDLQNSANGFYHVAYSSDGTRLYAMDQPSRNPVIYRFERGPGNAGGDYPWMHCDYATVADWVADGSPIEGYGQGPSLLWWSEVKGVAIYAAIAVGGWAVGMVRMGGN